VLKPLAPERPLYGEDEGERAGWFTVHVAPHRASEVNKVLADAGIFASGLEPGSDLETIFLEITHSASGTVTPATNAEPTPPPTAAPPPAAPPPPEPVP
jgi:hypothetical protein